MTKNVIDFKEKSAQKEGKVTPKTLIDNLSIAIQEDKIEGVIYITKDKDGSIEVGYSDMYQTEVMGFMECGKQIILNDMYEE